MTDSAGRLRAFWQKLNSGSSITALGNPKAAFIGQDRFVRGILRAVGSVFRFLGVVAFCDGIELFLLFGRRMLSVRI